MEEKKKNTLPKSEEAQKTVEIALYEGEVKKVKFLERKVAYLNRLVLKQRQQLSEFNAITRDEAAIVQELRAKHKFPYNCKEYPWMYNTNFTSKQDKLEALREWGNFLLDYAKNLLIHILDVFSLATESPFCDLQQNREQFLRDVFEYLSKNNDSVEWFDAEKTRLRIYWRSLKDWSEDLYDYMYLNGREIATLIDIKTVSDEIALGFKTLPLRDLKRVIDILVKNEQAHWIDAKTVKFHLV